MNAQKTIYALAIVGLIGGGAITGYAVKPDTISPQPQTLYDKVDDQTVRVTQIQVFSNDEDIGAIENNYKLFQAKKSAQKSDQDMDAISAGEFMDTYAQTLKAASAVGVADADTALKDLGITNP